MYENGRKYKYKYINWAKKKSEDKSFNVFVQYTYAIDIKLVWIMLSNYTDNALRLIFNTVNIKCS